MRCLVDISAELFDQAFHQFQLLDLNCDVQWCGSIVRCLVDISAELLDHVPH
jgi:hypothetical protein